MLFIEEARLIEQLWFTKTASRTMIRPLLMPCTITGLVLVTLGLVMVLEGLVLPTFVEALIGLALTVAGGWNVRSGMSQGTRLGAANWKSAMLKQWSRFCAVSAPLAVMFYVAGYFCLMNRHSPTTPAGAYHKFDSSFRWAPLDTNRKPRWAPLHQTPWPAVTIWNVIYRPMDNIYFRIWPRPSDEIEKLKSLGYYG